MDLLPYALCLVALCLIADSPLRLCTSAQMAAAKMDLVVLSISDISAAAGDISICIDIYRYRYIYTWKMDLLVLSSGGGR